MVITNASATTVSSWTASIDLNQSRIAHGWEGAFSVQGETLTAQPLGHNRTIAPSGSVKFGFCAAKLGTNWQPTVIGASAR